MSVELPVTNDIGTTCEVTVTGTLPQDEGGISSLVMTRRREDSLTHVRETLSETPKLFRRDQGQLAGAKERLLCNLHCDLCLFPGWSGLGNTGNM